MSNKAFDIINNGDKVIGDLLKVVSFANEQSMIVNSEEVNEVSIVHEVTLRDAFWLRK